MILNESRMVLDGVNSSILRIIEPYRKWIIENPKLLSELESTVQCLPYFTIGQFNNTFVSELLYSLSNLIVLFNDLLICNGKRMHLKFPQFESKIKIWLTVIEYSETLFEISAKKLWGQSGKWFIITVIQIFKTVLRLLLVHLYKECITKSPPIQPLNREKLEEPDEEKLGMGFTLKRSGTVVRSIRGINSSHMRIWEPLSPSVNNNDALTGSSASEKNLMLAETLYIVKPLLHLGCISITGEKHWPPWLLSFVIDFLSLKLVNKEMKNVSFSKEDEKEIFKRRLSLLLYILKSPFYDKYSRVKIYAILTALSNKVPLARFVAEPIKKYLPDWQNTYFYVWSS